MHSSSINWNVDSNKIHGIPEPKAPGGNGQMPQSVASMIMSGFMKIMSEFNNGIIKPDKATVEKLKKLSAELNKLKSLLNELTDPNKGKIPKDWASQVKKVMGEIQGTISSIPPGSLKTELEKSYKAVEQFINSPLRSEFATYIKDLNQFQKVWKKMLSAKHFTKGLEKEFKNSLELLTGDRNQLGKLVKNLSPTKYPTLYGEIKTLYSKFKVFYNKLMNISAMYAWGGGSYTPHSLGQIYWHDTSMRLSHWMKAVMYIKGSLKNRPPADKLTVSGYDNFKNKHVLENIIRSFEGAGGQMPLQKLGNLIHKMANNQNPNDPKSLYYLLHGLWEGFQSAKTGTSQGISAAQSLSDRFVVRVNTMLTEYKSIVELAIHELMEPEQEVNMILSRDQSAALGG